MKSAMNPETIILIDQYEAAKEAAIAAYRGLHQAPDYPTWNDVQDKQDEMMAAAVALAEHMLEKR